MSKGRARLLGSDADAREVQVAEVLSGATEHLQGRVLVVDDVTGMVAEGLTERGVEVDRWSRMCTGKSPGSPWPEGGMYDAATLRLPRIKDVYEFNLHAILSVLKPGGEVFVCGANDEGAKSAGKLLDVVFGEGLSRDTRRHCRVWSATRPADTHAKAPLSVWKTQVESPIQGRPWVSYPGVFSRGALDDGTALLIGSLPRWSGLRVLDFAAGGGVISGHLAKSCPDLKIWMLEADAVALEAAKENVPEATAIVSDAWALMPDLKVDRIVSNPPIHFGKSEDFRVIRSLVESSPTFLNKAGELWMVVQRQVPAQTLFGTNWNVELAAENTRFRVWRGILKD